MPGEITDFEKRLLALSCGPEGFRELREVCWNHFHLSWHLSDFVVPDYGLKQTMQFLFRRRYVRCSLTRNMLSPGVSNRAKNTGTFTRMIQLEAAANCWPLSRGAPGSLENACSSFVNAFCLFFQIVGRWSVEKLTGSMYSLSSDGRSWSWICLCSRS